MAERLYRGDDLVQPVTFEGVDLTGLTLTGSVLRGGDGLAEAAIAPLAVGEGAIELHVPGAVTADWTLGRGYELRLIAVAADGRRRTLLDVDFEVVR